MRSMMPGRKFWMNTSALTMTALSRNPETFVEKVLPSLRQCAQALGRRAGIIV